MVRRTSKAPASAPEVYVSCHSSSPRSHAAAEVANELAARRAGTVEPIDRVTSECQASVVAIDGCSSACGARLLEAHGVTPAATLTLDDLEIDEGLEGGASVAALRAAEARLGGGASPRRARRAAPALGPSRPSPRVHTVEDYLLAVDWLTSPVGPCGALVENAPTLAAHVSAALGVSRPTAGEMLNRLQSQGLIHRGRAKELVLTPAGRALADRGIRSHRILERFVVDTLGYDVADCFEQARRLAPSFDDTAIDRLDAALGFPGRCPHGWPTDAHAAREHASHLSSLSALEPGVQATVEGLPEIDTAALADIFAAGLTPGAEVTRVHAERTDGVVLLVNGRECRIRAATAMSVLARHEDRREPPR